MNTKYFQTGGITFQVDSEIEFKSNTFLPKFRHFEVKGPGKDNIIIQHYFEKPFPVDLSKKRVLYERFPWKIYPDGGNLIYEYLYNRTVDEPCTRKIVTNQDHTLLEIYNNAEVTRRFIEESQSSITLFPNDQILIARLLSDRQGCIFHSTGIVHQGMGYLFVGHSDEGKSTIAQIMDSHSTILCDDRNIIRKKRSGYTLSGTWYHSDFPKVSPLSAPLKAIFFLQQSKENQLTYVSDRNKRFNHIISRVIKPLATRKWWNATIDLIDDLSLQTDCLNLAFNKTVEAGELIKNY